MEKQLIEFLLNLSREYEISKEDYYQIEMWIQTLEAFRLEEN